MNASIVASQLVGKTEIEALKIIQNTNLLMNVTKRDDLVSIMTRDFNPSRILVSIANGIITGTQVG